MKKITALLCISLLMLQIPVSAQKPDSSWFEEARFGMFIHFGPYAVLGNGEWVMNNRNIPGQNYLLLQDIFNPQAFDAAEWVRIAKDAGMKYITLTSRHHDGFSNWDTKQSDWNIMNTPYGKDLIRQLADECRKEGIKLSLYYSTIDWMRSDYPYETGRTGKGTGRTTKSDWNSYFNFMKAQMTELLTQYGPIGAIWLDGHWDQTDHGNRTSHKTHIDWHYPEFYSLIRKLQPECLIANNHHLPPLEEEDFQIFERDVPGENQSGLSGQEISRLPLETCATMNDTWGFSITDNNFKSTRDLIHLLVRTAGTGANLLLNVGPMPNGKFQQTAVDRLGEMGEWMRRYGHTIYGTQKGFDYPQSWGASTRKDKTYYIHILTPEEPTLTIHIPEIQTATWINIDSKLVWKRDKKTGNVTFTLPEQLDPIDSIIEVKVK